MADYGGTQQRTAAERLKQIWNQSDPFPIALDVTPLKWKVAVSTACACKTQLEAALVYAQYGIPVFPCNWLPDEAGKVNKYPLRELGKGGLYRATIDAEVIGSWWTRWPLALIGRAAGASCWHMDVGC